MKVYSGLSQLIFVLLGASIPQLSWATVFLFPVSATDWSLSYLYFIFGTITDANPDLIQYNVINELMGLFIAGLLSLSLIALAYLSIRSVVVGSGSGHLLGERISELEAPIKTAVGLAFLIPDAHGYCTIQYIMMWCILNGIGLANALWGNIVTNYAMGNTLTTQKNPASDPIVDDVVHSLMYAALATSYLEQQAENIVPGAVDRKNSGLPVYVCNLFNLGTTPCNETTGIVGFPVKDPGTKAIKNTELTAQQLSVILEDLMMQMQKSPLIQYALAEGLNSSGLKKEQVEAFFGAQYCANTLNAFNQQLQLMLQPYLSTQPASAPDMLTNGWMTAAIYYWQLNQGISASPGADTILSQLAPINSSAIANSIYGYTVGPENEYYSIYGSSQKNIVAYIDTLYALRNLSTTQNGKYSPVVTNAGSSGLSKLMGMSASNFIIRAFFPNDSEDFFKLDYDFSQDRYHQFISENITIVKNIINFMQALPMMMLGLAIVAGLSKGQLPMFTWFFYTFSALMFMIIPLVAVIMTTALMGSVYASALPGVVFAAAALSWFLKVIEVVVAGPLIALAMIFPSEDSERAIEHILHQLLVVVFRPAIMILGFYFATKVCQLSIMFVGGAFNQLATEMAPRITGGGGMLFLVFLYEFTTISTISFISRAFNIVNVLPDAVFLMMGIQSHDSEAEELVGQIEQAGEKGAGSLSSAINILSGLSTLMTQVSKKMNSPSS